MVKIKQKTLYDLIYADPPWRYSFSRSRSRKIENQYPTMSVKEICAIRVPAKSDCVLFLWATAPKLLESLAVMKSWGFTYKTHAAWDKEKMGMGYWLRGQHELLLIGTRGASKPPEPQNRSSSLLREKRRQHSRKPEKARAVLERGFPNHSKLEMFAREDFPGWDRWES